MKSQDINIGEMPIAALTGNITALHTRGETLKFMSLASTLRSYKEKDKSNPKEERERKE